MRQRLEKITIKGFKTIKELKDFEPGSLTVLLGPNGAGKSNFISFFRLLSWMLSPPGGLQQHIGISGPASNILYEGPEKTQVIEAELTLKTDAGENQYSFKLAHAAGDTLVFTDEKFRYTREGSENRAPWRNLDAGHREANLVQEAEGGDQTARTILGLLRKIVVYQFHNTSSTARIRSSWDIRDNRWLKEDAANIAPFLYRLYNDEPKIYQRIVDTIRLILPFFADFEFAPTNSHMLLSWRERGSDKIFNASQAADGMLRAMALITLLLQPEKDLPDVLILDEPELGLHPYAINIIGGLVSSVSTQTQIILATQSTTLIDCFDPQDIVIVEREARATGLRRLSVDKLDIWLEDYTLSEIWEKNIIGGRP